MNGSSRVRQKGGAQDVVQGSWSGRLGKSAGIGGTSRPEGYRQGLKSRGSSAAIDGDVVPEDGIGGGSHLLSLAGREGFRSSPEHPSVGSAPWWSGTRSVRCPHRSGVAFRRNWGAGCRPTIVREPADRLDQSEAHSKPESPMGARSAAGGRSPGCGERYRYVGTKSLEVNPSFSPDGRWIAYASNETGAFEIYVGSFENPELRCQVSTQGGQSPQWRGDGKEL